MIYKKAYKKMEKRFRKTTIALVAIIGLSVAFNLYSISKHNKLQTRLGNTVEEYQTKINEKDNQIDYYVTKYNQLQMVQMEKVYEKITEELSDIYYFENVPLNMDKQKYAYYICDKYDIDIKIFYSMMKTESNFKTDAINNNTNNTQDFGILQINNPNHDKINKIVGRKLDYYNYYDNVLASAIVYNWSNADTLARKISMYNMWTKADEFYDEHGHYRTGYYKKVMENYNKLFDNER